MIGGIGFLLLIIGAGAADGNLGIATIMVLAGCLMCLYESKKRKAALNRSKYQRHKHKHVLSLSYTKRKMMAIRKSK